MGIIIDMQQIIYALFYIRSSATKYLTSYFDKNVTDKDLGSWNNFVKVLHGIYDQKDSKASMKEEFIAFWINKQLVATKLHRAIQDTGIDHWIQGWRTRG